MRKVAEVPVAGIVADVAQLVEHHLAKVRVAGSNPVVRSERVSPLGPSTGRPFEAQSGSPRTCAPHQGRDSWSWWSGREARQRTANPCTRVQIPSPPRAVGAAVARFPDTEEVAGSIPVPPTEKTRTVLAPARTVLCAFLDEFGDGHVVVTGAQQPPARMVAQPLIEEADLATFRSCPAAWCGSGRRARGARTPGGSLRPLWSRRRHSLLHRRSTPASAPAGGGPHAGGDGIPRFLHGRFPAVAR